MNLPLRPVYSWELNLESLCQKQTIVDKKSFSLHYISWARRDLELYRWSVPHTTSSKTLWEGSLSPHQELPEGVRQWREGLWLYNNGNPREWKTFFATHTLMWEYRQRAYNLVKDIAIPELPTNYPYFPGGNSQSLVHMFLSSPPSSLEESFYFYGALALIWAKSAQIGELITTDFIDFAKKYEQWNHIYIHDWTEVPEVIIWRDAALFHGRLGWNNVPLGRMWIWG